MKEILSDSELMNAWENAFEKGIYFDHKPTPEDIITLRLRAVAQAQAEVSFKAGIKEVVEWLEVVYCEFDDLQEYGERVNYYRKEWEAKLKE